MRKISLLVSVLVASALVFAWPMTGAAQTDPAPSPSPEPGLTASGIDDRLATLVGLGLEAALGDMAVTVLEPQQAGGFTLELDVPTSIDLPLSLEAVLGNLTDLLASSTDPSAIPPSSVAVIPTAGPIQPHPVSVSSYAVTGKQAPLVAKTPQSQTPPTAVPAPTAVTPNLAVPTATPMRNGQKVTEVDPCLLMLELKYLIEDTQNTKRCPGNDMLALHPQDPMLQVPQLIQDPINHVTSRMIWELAQLQRSLHDLQQGTNRERLNIVLADMARRSTSLEQLVEGLDAQVVAAANTLNEAINELAREVNEASLAQVTDIVAAIQKQVNDMQALVGKLADRLLGGIRNIIDDLNLIPRLPTKMPVAVCAKVISEVSGEKVALANFGADSVGDAATPVKAVPGQRIGLVPDKAQAGTLGGFESISCPDGSTRVSGITSLTGVASPTFVAPPVSADVLELLSNPKSMLDDVIDAGREVTIRVEVTIQAATKIAAAADASPCPADASPCPADASPCPSGCVTRTVSSPEFTIKVPAIPVPILGFGFTHRRHEGKWLNTADYFGTVVSAPANSTIKNVETAFATLQALKSTIGTTLALLFPNPEGSVPWNSNSLQTTGSESVKSAASLYVGLAELLDIRDAPPIGDDGTDVGLTFMSEGNLNGVEWFTRADGTKMFIEDEVRTAAVVGPPKQRSWCWDSIEDYAGSVAGWTEPIWKFDWPMQQRKLHDVLTWYDDAGRWRINNDHSLHSDYPFIGSGTGTFEAAPAGKHHYDVAPVVVEPIKDEDGVSRWFWAPGSRC